MTSLINELPNLLEIIEDFRIVSRLTEKETKRQDVEADTLILIYWFFNLCLLA